MYLEIHLPCNIFYIVYWHERIHVPRTKVRGTFSLCYVNLRSDKMKLKILGTQSPYSTIGHNCPGFLVSDGENKIMLDCGSGNIKISFSQNEHPVETYVIKLTKERNRYEIKLIPVLVFIWKLIEILPKVNT